MASAIITFGKSALGKATFVPLKRGNSARSERIEIEAASGASELSAAAGEDVVKVYAGSDCWVQIGAAPAATAIEVGTETETNTSWFLAEGSFDEFTVEVGDKVAVVAG